MEKYPEWSTFIFEMFRISDFVRFIVLWQLCRVLFYNLKQKKYESSARAHYSARSNNVCANTQGLCLSEMFLSDYDSDCQI